MHPAIVAIEHEMEGFLAPRGFQKRRSAWHRTVADVLQVVGLWKNSTGRYYLDFGVHVNTPIKKTPRLSDLDLQWSTHAVIETYDERSQLIDALNPTEPVADDARVAVVISALKTIVFPRLDACSSKAGVREVLMGKPSGYFPTMCYIDHDEFCARVYD